MEREIVVKGAGSATSQPDVAFLWVTAEGTHPSSREAAYERAAAVARQVDEVIETRRASFRRVTVASLYVEELTERDKNYNRTRIGWRAERTTRLDVTVFESLSNVISELVSAGGTLRGPRWAIDMENAAYQVARRAAAVDARQRALDYATALGLDAGGVAWVSEPGLRVVRGGGAYDDNRHYAAMGAPPTDSSGGEVTVIDVKPEEITVEAAVEVGFAFLGSPEG